ncbi:MAG: DUF2341 domain-containing protein [Deltaproteobacteria bacterium]|nr:DUF2341 domain-containing protein [Deltaproteobacteria bacterium]
MTSRRNHSSTSRRRQVSRTRCHRASAPFLMALCSVAVATAPTPVFAQQTSFDMESAGQDQQGNYEASPDVELSNGVARLAERSDPAWNLPQWSYRLEVRVTNDTDAALSHFPLRIDLASAPIELFDESRLDGFDLTITDASGTKLTPRWVEWFDFIARQGVLWFRVANLPTGQSTFYLYFGNPDADDPGSAEAMFTYQDVLASTLVLSPLAAAAQMTVESFVDHNHFELSSSADAWDLDERETHQITSGLLQATLIAAKGPYYGAFDADGTDALAPLCYDATEFIYPAPRYSDILDLFSPYGDAHVNVYEGATLVANQVVSNQTVVTMPADVTDGHALRIESDIPIVVHRRVDHNGTAYDAMSYLPPNRELVGANSGTGLLVALHDNTDVWIYDSSPDFIHVTLDAGQVYALAHAGSQGSGPAIHIIASGPVAALSYGDGDGGEAVTFMPRWELGRRYLIPLAAEYVLVGTASPVVTCQILDQSGHVLAQQTSDGLAPPYPNRLKFDAVPAGAELSCDKPVYAMAEDAATNDERNLWPMKIHRPVAHPALAYDLGTVETKYPQTDGWVTTPLFVPAEGMARLASFHQTAQQPEGTAISYQLSNDQGQTWYYFDGDQWKQAVLTSQSNRAHEVNAAAGRFDVSDGTVEVRAILTSTTGTKTPILDQVDVGYVGPGQATTFVFSTIDGTKVAGIPFSVTITALDENGLEADVYQGSAFLATLHDTVFPRQTPNFDHGSVTLDLAVAETGPHVVLLATASAVFGQSDPFSVVAPDHSSLAIEVVSGDQQVGTTSSTLPDKPTVRVTSQASGYPVPSVDVIFRVVEGGGLVGNGTTSATTFHVTTDAGGLATVSWTTGTVAGANVMEAVLDGATGSPVRFEARADPAGAKPDERQFWASGGGGCSCRTMSMGSVTSFGRVRPGATHSGRTSPNSGNQTNGPSGGLLFLLLMGLVALVGPRLKRRRHVVRRDLPPSA